MAELAPSSGETLCIRPTSGKMVMQLTEIFLVGGSDPGRMNKAPLPTVGRLGFEPPTENSIAFGKAPRRGERGQNMLYIGYLIILDGQSIKKINFRKFHF